MKMYKYEKKKKTSSSRMILFTVVLLINVSRFSGVHTFEIKRY